MSTHPNPVCNTRARCARFPPNKKIKRAPGVVVLGTLRGILVAVAISLLTLFYQANHPPVYAVRRKPGTDVFRPQTRDHPEDETIPDLLIVRTEGRMTFASAPRVRQQSMIDMPNRRPEQS